MARMKDTIEDKKVFRDKELEAIELSEEFSEGDMDYIAGQIQGGFTSGIFESEGYRVNWNLKVNKFEN